MHTRQLTAIIEREGDGYVALCPEVDVASQGTTIGEARANLIEALELFFETADARYNTNPVARARAQSDRPCAPASFAMLMWSYGTAMSEVPHARPDLSTRA